MTTYMTFGGPFTSFHAVDSTDVIIPKHVEIYGYFGDFWKETMDVPGFDVNAVETVHCEYVDSRNYPVRFDGVRT